MRSIEIRLIGHRSGAGEILGDDAVHLVQAVKDLVYRLTRAAADRAGLGRAPAVIEQLSTVRLSLAEGSTRLIFRVGEEEALDIDPLAADVDAALFVIASGIRDNIVPEGTGASVAAAAHDLVVALRHAAPKVDVTIGGLEPVQISASGLDPRAWEPEESAQEDDRTVVGTLEAVDLRSAHFRIVDAVMNRIELMEVEDPSRAAVLVGQRVSARGRLVLGGPNARTRLMAPTVVADETEIETTARQPSLDWLIAEAANAPKPEPLDLSPDELREFLAAARG